MASARQVQRNLSLMLSEVLSEIGINDEQMTRKREFTLMLESLNQDSLLNVDGQSVHFIGSLSDGSSIEGMHSADDILICSYHVIKDLSDWKSGVTNLLIVQDENTAPGYCFLQLLRNDRPLAATYIPSEKFNVDDKGRIVLSNRVHLESMVNTLVPDATVGVERHCPALGPLLHTTSSKRDSDIIPALRCERWPIDARPWFYRTSTSGWPSGQLKFEATKSGCFLFPVSSMGRGRNSRLSELEWRISLASAERMLLFSLNTTNMKCYVLVKILLRSHININGVSVNAISSYICKTALFHCVENTNRGVWEEDNLIGCLNLILKELHKYVLNTNCPHYIIPENNVLAGRITPEERQQLLANLEHIIQNVGTIVYELQTDDIGVKLQQKMNAMLEAPNEFKQGYCYVKSIIGFLKRPLKFLYWCCVVYGWVCDV